VKVAVPSLLDGDVVEPVTTDAAAKK